MGAPAGPPIPDPGTEGFENIQKYRREHGIPLLVVNEDGTVTDPTTVGSSNPIEDLIAKLEAEEEEDAAAASGPSSTSGSFSSSSQRTSTTKRVGRFREESNRVIQSTVRQYVDIPTAAEVLDDFETSFQTFVQNLPGISQSDAALAQDLQQEFLGEYLADLGQRALRGEEVFKVVGITGKNKKLGTRAGEQEIQKTKETSQRVGTTKEKGTSSESSQESQSRTTTQDGESASASEQTSGTSTQTSDDTLVSDDVTESAGKQTFKQKEEIVSRPKLAIVSSVSPLSYLADRFKNPGEFTTVVRSRAGRQQALRERGTAGVTVAARGS